MTLEQTIQRIHTIADQLLVSLAEEPASRYMIALPPLADDVTDVPVMDCLEYRYAIARLREVLTYKYLLNAWKNKQLEVSRELLASCLASLRKSPVIDYYDLGDYHEMAFHYYKKAGDEKKAQRHLISCYFDRGRAIISADKVFDSKDLIMALLKDRRRMEAFIWYVLDFILHDFEDIQEYMTRTQYLLMERILVLAVKLFAENAECNKDLRCGVYTLQSLYYGWTERPEEAKAAKQACLQLGGKKKYAAILKRILKSKPAPRLADQRFLDYVLYINVLEETEVYPMDQDENLDLDAPYDFFILAKDGRTNFLDTFYRPMSDALKFLKTYDLAEQGDAAAIQNIARRYREGDGITACLAASQAWEKK